MKRHLKMHEPLKAKNPFVSFGFLMFLAKKLLNPQVERADAILQDLTCKSSFDPCFRQEF